MLGILVSVVVAALALSVGTSISPRGWRPTIDYWSTGSWNEFPLIPGTPSPSASSSAPSPPPCCHCCPWVGVLHP